MDNIDKIRINDLEEVRKLCLSRWADLDEWFDIEKMKFFLERYSEYCIKFHENKKILGVILGDEMHKCLDIKIFLVEESQRGKGIGLQLLKHIEKVCRKNKLKTIFLTSGERDYATGAFNFYTKSGFKVAGFKVTHGEIALLFEKKL